MPRIMTIWFPRWPVQRRLAERPAWRKRPVFVCRRESRGLMTVVAWAWAEPPKREHVPIQPGMSLAEAMGVLALAYGSQACHVAEIDADDPAADTAALEQLARTCRRFAPIVGIEAVPPRPGRSTAGMAIAQECLYLDVTNTASFFGGEASLSRTAAWALAARGFHARTAIADTPAAAWAAAHYTELVATEMLASARKKTSTIRRDGIRLWQTLALPPVVHGAKGHGKLLPRRKRSVVVPPGAQRLARGDEAVLASLPLAALRLEPNAIDMLREVGVETIGGVLRLPAKSLASRFPASVSRRLAEFTGARAEPIEPPHGEQLPQSSHDFELPLSLAGIDEAAIANLLEQLVGRCTTSLAARGEGIVSLQVRLEPAVTATTMATIAPTVIDIGVFRPSSLPRHLVDLVRLRMGRMKLPREIGAIAVDVVAAGPAVCRQRSLFEMSADGSSSATVEAQAAEVGLLLDRLAGRLGRPAVFAPQLVADAQPEHAWFAAPPAAVATRGSGNRFQRAGVRPVWMPTRPIPLEGRGTRMPVEFRLGCAVHRILKAHGPERIETAWWRGPTVRRDYYMVETESGVRFWLFRRLCGRTPGSHGSSWYLHGVFA